MKITSKFHEVKTTSTGAKLIEGDFILEDGQEVKATIWREDKNKIVFPNFDTLAPGHEFQAEPWKHPTKGTYTLYPPKLNSGASGGVKGAGISKLMDKKDASIEKFQDKKESSIEKMACQRDSILLVTTFYKDQMLSDTEISEKIEYWRKYLSQQLDKAPF